MIPQYGGCPPKKLAICEVGVQEDYDDVIKWKHFPRYWSFVRGIHRSPVNSTHKGQWSGALMLSLIYAWIYGWVNNPEAGELRRHRAHYDVIVMFGHNLHSCGWMWPTSFMDQPLFALGLPHWSRDKMAAIFQTTFSNAFSWMKMFKFRLRFHGSLFPRVQLMIFQHWFGYLNHWWLVYWRIYASLGLNVLTCVYIVSRDFLSLKVDPSTNTFFLNIKILFEPKYKRKSMQV